MVIALKTVQWAQVAAPFCAAAAAAASWMAVRQSSRAYREMLLPRLKGIWQDPSAPGGSVRLELVNTGSGFAHNASFFVVRGSQYVSGPIKRAGLMEPKEISCAYASLPPIGDEDVIGVLFCEDYRGRWHVWSWQGRHRRPRNRVRWPIKDIDPERALRTHFPDVDCAELNKSRFTYETR